MSANLFNTVKMARPPRNIFDLSHDFKFSCDMGMLVPTLVLECVPGDRFNLSCENLVRFAPLINPVMHRFDVYTHYFFVPNRILWDNWEEWITQAGAAQPGYVPPAFPYITIDKDLTSLPLLPNYMGIPNPESVAPSADFNVSALPFAAYQKIWYEYYRDQNLQDVVDTPIDDGSNGTLDDPMDPITLCQLKYRAWEHDYFTSALPFAQKGPAVQVPIGEVVLKDNWDTFGQPQFRDPELDPGDQGSLAQTLSGGQNSIQANASGIPLAYDPAGTLSASATTINDLRYAFRLQEWFEKNARGGTRYTEHLRVHFAVRSSDARLQRPEYITGTKSPVVISEVLNTTGTEDAPQGNMAGHGISVTNGKYGSYYCEEHGFIIGIQSVMPKTAYQQGLAKHWLKITSPYQYYFPTFANLGEQEVLQAEVYAWSNTPAAVFGYTPRYAEYKYMPSRVAGEFRTTLATYHAGRIFETEPQLNEDFVVCDATKRIFAVTEQDNQTLWCHTLHKIRASRQMPKYGTPTF